MPSSQPQRDPLTEPTALRLTRATLTARRLARILVIAALFFVCLLLLAPWQQSIRGNGRVIAYAPLDRTQNLEAPITGRVVAWMVEEGGHVAEGEPIARLADNDPDILDRIEREREAARGRIEAARRSIELNTQRIEALTTARQSAIDGARFRAGMAVDRELAAQQAVDAAQANLTANSINLDRMEKMVAEGLASRRSFELARLADETARADLSRAKAALAAARREVKALRTDVQRIESDAGAGIDAAEATRESARSEFARAEQELASVESRLARQDTMTIFAPRDGTVLRMVARQGGEMVKVGDPIAVFVPDTDARAVELWVDGLDAPLITPGRKVRLQFEGWPAVQFVGWPAVAVGTFGGVVAFVDATDNGYGKFRTVVIPDFEGEPEDDWPPAQYLRQGVRANGWILLEQVSLGFELWRQFNGFPPVLSAPPDGDALGVKTKGDGK